MTTISKRKPNYNVGQPLKQYLEKYGRTMDLPVSYADLLRYTESFPLMDKNGNDTLWESVVYDGTTTKELHKGLTFIYSLLKSGGDLAVTEHLYVARVDYCTFGNSNPFRIRIVNQFNDNYDHFYVKKADASRIYGLELEHILSPNRINFSVCDSTLIEEHIAGLPGDIFIDEYLERSDTNKVRIAKEFVKFNERCFVRLLGDMRSYNYVVDITPDFEEVQYRVRPIDFDQQSYEGKKTMYLPQFFKENNPIVKLCIELMTPETFDQYRHEERTLIARRMRSAKYKIADLLHCMRLDDISTPEKIDRLKIELNNYHKTDEFDTCKTMGDIVSTNLRLCLEGK